MEASAKAPLLQKACTQTVERGTDGDDHEQPPQPRTSGAKDHWRLVRVKVTHAVHVRHKMLSLQSLARDTALMRNKSEKARQRYVIIIMALIVVLGAITAMTKSAMFHMNAVGRWDHGLAYKFSYALSLTLVVFLLKVCLVFVKVCFRNDDDESDHEEGGDEEDSEPISLYDRVMPWALLLSFTFFEMLSATVASLGLVYGAPTSVFVIFKSSKTIFLALLSVVILRRRLNAAQWTALVMISLALTMATVAEGKGGKKGSELNLVGPLLLTISELFHAGMLVLQEISVRHYWDDPLALLSASAVIGVVLTLVAMRTAQQVWVVLPDGARHPASDTADAMLMCFNNPVLGLTMILHLIAHVSSDVTHIVILKHISALARTLCDAVKLILMWLLGKAFWLFGFFPVLAEAWHPGLIGSWLMLPAIAIIIYAMLMFKDANFFPLHVKKTRRPGKDAEGVGVEETTAPTGMGSEKVKVNLEDPFYTAMFRSKKLSKKHHHADPVKVLRRSLTTAAHRRSRGGSL